MNRSSESTWVSRRSSAFSSWLVSGLRNAPDSIFSRSQRALAVRRDVLDLVGDRAAVGLAQVGQRVGERGARDVRAEDPRWDARHHLRREAERLRVQRRVALGLAAERVQAGGQVAVHAVGLEQRDGGLHGLEHRLVGLRAGDAVALRARAVARLGGGQRRSGRLRRGAELRAEVLEDGLVELVVALQVGLDDLQELAGLGALDDPMVVGRRHRHHLLGADRRADVAEPRRVADGAGGDDRALAAHQARDGGDRADAARVGERDVGALEVVGGELVLARLGDQLVERGKELREREPAGVADHGDHQRAPAVLLLHVDGDAEVDLADVDHVRLAVDLGERARHHRHLLGRGAGDRVGDQVGEGDALAGVLELLAAAVERGDRDRAERGRGRDRARLVHVAREHRACALQERGAVGLAVGGRRRLGVAVGGGQHVGLGDAPGGAAALDGVEIDAVGGGDASGHGGDVGVVGRRRHVAGGSRRGGRLGRGCRRLDGSRVAAAASMRAMTWPTSTVSPASARISVSVPEAGEGTSASTLSVEISTIVSSISTLSPAALAHSRIVPSETDSPIWGIVMSTVLASAGASSGASALRSWRAAIGAAGAVGRDLGEDAADVDGVALGGVDLHDGAGGGGRDLRVDLVGRDLDDRLVLGDRVALLLVPLQDGAVGNRLTHRRHDNFHRGVDRHVLFRPYRVRAAVPACADGVLARRIRRCPRTARDRPRSRP